MRAILRRQRRNRGPTWYATLLLAACSLRRMGDNLIGCLHFRMTKNQVGLCTCETCGGHN